MPLELPVVPSPIDRVTGPKRRRGGVGAGVNRWDVSGTRLTEPRRVFRRFSGAVGITHQAPRSRALSR